LSAIIGELNTNDSSTIEQLRYGNGIVATRTTDGLGNPISIDYGRTLALEYTFDESGRISGINRNAAQQIYQYDPLGQLSLSRTASGSYNYEYDALGNRTSLISRASLPGSYETSAEGHGNKLLKAGGHRYQYDDAGNTESTNRFRYEYNQKSRPIRVFDKETNHLVAEYGYNSFGERVKKVRYHRLRGNFQKKAITYYLYDGRRIAAEISEDGEVVAQYLYYKKKLVAKLEGRSVRSEAPPLDRSLQMVDNTNTGETYEQTSVPYQRV